MKQKSPRVRRAPARCGSGTCSRLMLGSAVLMAFAACSAEPKTVALKPFEVEREWRRSVGEPQLELAAPRTGISDAGVVVFFRPTATVDRVEISRAFAVTSEATVLRTARRDEAALELESVAAAEVGQRYPALASNAEAAIAPSDFTLREVVIDVDGRPSFGDLRMSIEPQSAVFGSAKPALLPASDVAVVAARLVGLDESRTVLVEGELELPAQAGEQRFVFPIASLGELDCRRLRSLRLGEYEVVAECEIRTGTRSVTSVERTFPVLAEREWLDPVRRAARERLAKLATTPTGAALAFELADASRYAVRGERLPGVVVVNRSSQPILDLRAFSVAYQIKRPDGLEFVGSGGADGDPCLCPGDSISIESSEALQPCGEAIEGEGGEHGLVILVSSSGLDPRRLGPLQVVAVDASGAQLSPPRMAGLEVVVEAACAVDATNLELRLSIEGEGEIVVPFPAIAAGGLASLTLPASLGPETLAIWEGWRGGGRRVEVELLEAALWGCEEVAPSRQAFRMGN